MSVKEKVDYEVPVPVEPRLKAQRTAVSSYWGLKNGRVVVNLPGYACHAAAQGIYNNDQDIITACVDSSTTADQKYLHAFIDWLWDGPYRSITNLNEWPRDVTHSVEGFYFKEPRKLMSYKALLGFCTAARFFQELLKSPERRALFQFGFDKGLDIGILYAVITNTWYSTVDDGFHAQGLGSHNGFENPTETHFENFLKGTPDLKKKVGLIMDTWGAPASLRRPFWADKHFPEWVSGNTVSTKSFLPATALKNSHQEPTTYTMEQMQLCLVKMHETYMSPMKEDTDKSKSCSPNMGIA